MEQLGVFDPDTKTAARERYDSLTPVASEAIRSAARAMGFDGAEYDERVTDDVIRAVQDAMFASLLVVSVGSQAEFDDWRAEYGGEVDVLGSEHVDNVVWHAPSWTDTAVAATFAEESDAAAGTLRTQAFGRFYNEVVR